MENLAEKPVRLASLDFMRGIIMVLLALESAGLYEHLSEGTEGSFAHHFVAQFFHAKWHGLHFWDLIQPAFMFMAGVAMAYSLHNQQKKGCKMGTFFWQGFAPERLAFLLGCAGLRRAPQRAHL